MIASNAPAPTMTHLAHGAGKKKMAITTTAAANKKRQKHTLIVASPSLENFHNHMKKRFKIQVIFKISFPQKSHNGPQVRE